MFGVLQDAKGLFVAMRQRPGLYAVIVGTLALGIGVNTTFFTFFNGMVLRPLPFAAPDRLVAIHETQARVKRTQRPASAANLRDWQTGSRAFASIGAYVQRSVDLHSTTHPERVTSAKVSASLFPTLGVAPALGRTFLSDEDRPDGRPVALIGDAIWERRFSRDPRVLGRTIYLDNRPHEIVGVMPAGFRFPHVADVWTPLALDPADTDRGRRWIDVVARLAPGTSLAQAQADVAGIADRLARAYPGTNDGWSVRVRGLRDAWLPPVTRYSSVAQQISVAFVLLIACANVATLMLARAAARRYEVALKAALGATRGRLIRQFLTEGLVLAALGGALGTAAAFWGDTWMRGLVQVRIPYWLRFELDARALIFALCITALTGIAFSLVPALRHSKADASEVLRAAGRTGDAAGGNGLRRLLVIAQFALSAILLVGASLMIRSFLRVEQMPVGYRTDHVLTASLSLSGDAYAHPAQRVAFVHKMRDRVASLAPVVSADVVTYLPASRAGYAAVAFDVDGEVTERDEVRTATRHDMTAGYFDTAGIPLIDGRTFTPEEIEQGRDVVMVSQRLAARAWPTGQVIGRRLRLRESGSGSAPASGPASGLGQWLTVIGVVGDVEPAYQIGGLDQSPREQLYLPYGRDAAALLTVVVHTRSEPAELAPDVRAALQALDPTVPVYDVLTLAQVLQVVNWVPRLWSQLFSLFGALALLMAAAGTYSVSAYAVSRRTREIGIRLALGARRGGILALVLKDALIVCALGSLIGLAAALPLGTLLARLLYGVDARDPLIFGGVALLLAGVSLAAASVPAHRASRLSPTHALRTD